jgi:hypothetical protein
VALQTVSEVIRQARVLVQDNDAVAYRYSDAEFLDAINMALLEMRRIRPELMRSYFSAGVPTLTSADNIPVDEQYRTAVLYYTCGQVQLRDDENTQDARASQFLQKFTAQLLTIAS